MSAGREGMKIRSCGCITYDYGPPHVCEKHERKQQVQDEKGLRQVVREQCRALGHDLTLFTEFESYPGKWTAFCHTCERIVIVYDTPPARGDQVAGRPLTEECK